MKRIETELAFTRVKKVSPDCLLPTMEKADLTFVRGEGSYLFDAEGRRYLDFYSGIAVTSLGHAHPRLVETLRANSDLIWHISNQYRIPEQERLARRLVERSFADRAFFCNSGLEAAEAAIKSARRTHYGEGSPRRVRVITIEGAFHGRSLAGLAATNNKKYLEGFGPVVPGFVQVPFGDVRELEKQIDEETAAVMLEPIQGEGGVRKLAVDYIREVRRLCTAKGALLIVDEVQSGMGRSGRLFAYEWSGIEPDIMMLAKGLGGGFPIGAILVTERVARHMTKGTHGSTFGGNPLAMAIANSVLDELLKPGFLENVQKVSDMLFEELCRIQVANPRQFLDVRGAGLLLGLKCALPADDYVDALRNSGMLAHTAGQNVLRLLPPLIIEPSHVHEAVEHLAQVVRVIRSRGLESHCQ